MRSSTLRNSGLVAAAASALVAIGIPMALAAPTATPPSDAEGYVDSTARCTKPDTAVLFGTTQSSRVAICKTADGSFEYRGVRVRDGAKLVAPATQTSGTSFAVDSDGVKYTVTPIALSVTANGDTFRTETWTDFHGPRATGRTAPSGTGPSGTGPSGTGPSGTGPSGTGPSGTGPSGTGQPGSSAAAGSGAAPSKSATTPGLASPTLPAPQPPAAPPLPPLAAEVGGGSSAGE